MMYAAALQNAEMVEMLLNGGADPIFIDDDGYRADEHAKGHEGVLAAFAAYGFHGPSSWLTQKWFLETFGCWTPPSARRYKARPTPDPHPRRPRRPEP